MFTQRLVPWVSMLFLIVGSLLAGWSISDRAPTVAQAKPHADIEAAKDYWNRKFCSRCHGELGQGALGPPLAGQNISFESFRRQVRQPWGIMPAFVETQISDQDMRNLVEWFNGMPAPATAAPWRVPVRPGDPVEKRLFTGKGCAQCHGEFADRMRQGLGETEWDLARFIRNAREHTHEFPEGQMGNFTELQVSDDDLGRIWGYLTRLGVRVPVRARMTATASAGNRVTYSFTLENPAVYHVDQLFIAAVLPDNVTVVNAGSSVGAWHRGIEGGSDGIPRSAVWLAERVPAKGQIGPLTFEVEGPGAGDGSRIWARWLGPTPGGDIVTTPLVRPAR